MRSDRCARVSARRGAGARDAVRWASACLVCRPVSSVHYSCGAAGVPSLPAPIPTDRRHLFELTRSETEPFPHTARFVEEGEQVRDRVVG